MNAIDERHDEDDPRTTRAVLHLPQLEQHDALVLLDHPHRRRQSHERHEDDRNDHIDDHGLALLLQTRDTVRSRAARATALTSMNSVFPRSTIARRVFTKRATSGLTAILPPGLEATISTLHSMFCRREPASINL